MFKIYFIRNTEKRKRPNTQYLQLVPRVLEQMIPTARTISLHKRNSDYWWPLKTNIATYISYADVRQANFQIRWNAMFRSTSFTSYIPDVQFLNTLKTYSRVRFDRHLAVLILGAAIFIECYRNSCLTLTKSTNNTAVDVFNSFRAVGIQNYVATAFKTGKTQSEHP